MQIYKKIQKFNFKFNDKGVFVRTKMINFLTKTIDIFGGLSPKAEPRVPKCKKQSTERGNDSILPPKQPCTSIWYPY